MMGIDYHLNFLLSVWSFMANMWTVALSLEHSIYSESRLKHILWKKMSNSVYCTHMTMYVHTIILQPWQDLSVRGKSMGTRLTISTATLAGSIILKHKELPNTIGSRYTVWTKYLQSVNTPNMYIVLLYILLLLVKSQWKTWNYTSWY